MITKKNYTSGNPGPKLLILGAIHGNEVCGPIALNRLIADLDESRLQVICGSVTIIPICNPKAYALKQRYYEVNLNRVFKPGCQLDSYEGKLAEYIRKEIDLCDYLLDIHSMSSNGDSFLFKSIDGSYEDLNEFAKATLIPTVLEGRSDLYEESGERTTDQYAGSIGKKGVCIECGQHDDPVSIDVAELAIRNCMRYLGLVKDIDQGIVGQKTIRMTHLVRLMKEGTVCDAFEHGQIFSQGESVCTYYDGTFELAPYNNSILLLPKKWAKMGGEWFYWGVEI